jgi:putative CocE/NonD family hydrolase
MFRPLRKSIPSYLVLSFLIFLLTSSSLVFAGQVPVTSNQGTSPSYEVLKVEESCTMWDGMKLPVSVFYPQTVKQGESFPLIVFVHPWAMNKTLYDVAAKGYAARGYVCATYTVRGWFGAEGSISCIDPQYEMEDFPVLRDAKGPVVGVTGYSMGGVHSFLIAPRKNPLPGDPGDPRVRAVVPMHGGADLLFSLYPNNCLKLLWTTLLVGSAYIGNVSGLLMNSLTIILDQQMNLWQKLGGLVGEVGKMQSIISNVSPELGWVAGVSMQRSEADEEQAKQYLKVRSARYWCDQEMDGVVEHPITVPTLIVAGWQDDLFYANEGLGIFSTCMAAPSRMIVTNHGHIGGMGGDFMGLPESPESEWINGEVERWFDRYLKGVDNGVEKDPRLMYFRQDDPLNYGKAPAYPQPGTKNVSYYLGDGAGGQADMGTSSPQPGFSWPDILINTGLTGAVSILYYQDISQLMGGQVMDIPQRIKLFEIPYSTCAFTTDPLASDVEILGTPKLEIYYQSQQRFCQLIPFLYEVTPQGEEVLVSRGYYEGQKLVPWSLNSTAGQPVEMQAIYHRFKAGSRIGLELATADMLMTWPVWGFNFIVLPHGDGAPSRVILPVISMN